MATRTNPTEVKIIIDTQLSSPSIQVYIDVANGLVTEKLSTSSLSSDRLTDIEKWLSAHFIATIETRTTIKEKVGEAQADYAGAYGKGLDSTQYGQTVKLLDTTGAFASSGKRIASITAIKSFD